MLKAATLGLAAQQKTDDEPSVFVYQHIYSTARMDGRGTMEAGNLCPIFHKLLASTWQAVISPPLLLFTCLA